MIKPFPVLIFLSIFIFGGGCFSKKNGLNISQHIKNSEYDKLILDAEYSKDYNKDSTFIIICRTKEILVGEPLFFYVFNVSTKEKVFNSEKVYFTVGWSDTFIISMLKNPLPNGNSNFPVETGNKKFYNIKQKAFVKSN